MFFFQIQTRFIYFSEVRVVSAEETLKVIVNQIFFLILSLDSGPWI